MQLNPRQTKCQIILWRENANEMVRFYELQIVTYGSVSASYLATKFLHHLAKIILSDFYVLIITDYQKRSRGYFKQRWFRTTEIGVKQLRDI